MTRLSEIDRYKGLRFFVKFVNEEHLDSLLEGKLYMNTLGHFIEQEKATKKRGQGDKYEGAYVSPVQRLQLFDNETGQLIATSKSGVLHERYERVETIPVFCFTVFTAKDFKVNEEKEDGASFVLDIPEEEQEKILDNFGDKAVLLPNSFLKNLEEDANNQKLEYIIRSVSYEDYTVGDPVRRKKFEEGSTDMITWKDSFFEYQREARFAILNHHSHDPYEFQMRSLREESNTIDAEKFLKNCSIEVKDRSFHND